MHNTEKGFTLIEMAIVLVIIGLIVGGVLTGRDLIQAAAVRATISQIEKYNTAVNTFYGKYQALPGDMNATVAQAYGFTPRTYTYTSYGFQGKCQGDSNGIIEGVGCQGNGPGWETSVFWNDLTAANGLNLNLVEGSFTLSLLPFQWSIFTNMAPIPPTMMSLFFPTAKIGRGNYIYVTDGSWIAAYNGASPPLTDGYNYFNLSGVTPIDSMLNPIYPYMGLTVREAFSIDSKIDDALPQSGRVIAAAAGFWATGNTSKIGLSDCGHLGPNGMDRGPVVNVNQECGGDTSNPNGGGYSGARSSSTCYDYADIVNGPTNPPNIKYALYNSDVVNCSLSFRFQ
jgi:prepilin-type N-terminal cleavage/methylation domain-containing protein